MQPEPHTLSTLPWTRLPLGFDAAALQREVDAIDAFAWQPHFHAEDYEGQWSSVALRSRSGKVGDIFPQGSPAEFQDTPLLAHSPGLRAVLQQFAMPLKSVRLMRLHAGSRVHEHSDRDLGLGAGEVRIHVPVRTSDAVEFIVAGRRLRLREGESWYIDFSLPHRIHNGGATDRIHLVIDGALNEWAADLLASAAREIATDSEEPQGAAALRAFCEEVFESPELQQVLLACPDRVSLTSAVLQQGESRGHRFHPDDVTALMNANRQAWLMRSLSL